MSFFISGLAARFAAGSALSCALIGAAVAQPSTAPPLFAAALPAVPTLSQAVEAAWQRAAQAREAQGQTQRANAERAAVSSLWAAPPALELSYRDDRWQTSAGRKETEAGLAWPLWLPGQRNARGAAVDADLELAQAAVQAGRLHFAGLVREAVWGIAAQQAEADLADAQVRSLQEIADDVRRRVNAGLNKGEARNALARAVFFNRLGEIRDRSFEQQRYRASGLTLVTAAIVLWNTVYLERATNALRENGHAVDETLLKYLSPLGWEHINLTGDYLWRSRVKTGVGKFRPLRPLQ